ncbi:MFS transporter [Flavobacterium sp. JP2137]|uniref:MFS transporter n=1 Tax=Flavobacterium sp. JP2137 TaxID=3414510 RepID=UPI003D2F9EF2
MKKILQIYIDSYKGLSSASWMLAFVMLLNRSGSMVLPFLGVYMTGKLGFSLEQSGYVLACFGVGSLVGSFFGGWLTDQIGNFKVQSLSLFLSAPMFAIMPLFDTPLGLGCIMLIQSTISEVFRPANSVAITVYARPENITRAFSLNRMAVNLGFSIGPAMGGMLASISYALLFYINAVAAFLAGCLFVYFFINKKSTKELHKDKQREMIQPEFAPVERSPYRDGPFILFNLFCAFYAIAFFQLFSTLPIFYQEVAKLSQFDIGIILGYSGLIIFILEMLLVHVAEKKLTITQIIVFGVLLTGIGYGMLAFSHGLIIIYVSMTVLCISEMLALPFTSTVTALRSGANNKGAYMGFNGLAFASAFVISPILGTKIAKMYNFEILWMGTAALTVISAVGFYFVVQKMLATRNA